MASRLKSRKNCGMWAPISPLFDLGLLSSADFSLFKENEK
jgi:hypothetical protein